jgi:putative permease
MNRNQKIKLYLFLLILGGAILFALLFPRLTLPFGFAYIIYLMSKPLTLRLTTGSKKQRLGYFFLILSGTALLSLPILVTLYSSESGFSTFSSQLPEIQRILNEKFLSLKSFVFEKYKITLNIDPVSFIMTKLETHGVDVLSRFPDYLSMLFEWILLVPIFLYFFFMESHRFIYRFLESIPNPIFEKSYVLFSQFNTKFGEYIIAKFIEATLLGSLVTVGLILIDFPFPFILGFFAGITNILPYIGPLIGIVPAIFVALLSKDPGISMIAMLVIFSVANLIDMILVFPLLVSKIVNLHPIVVVISIMVGSQIAGIIGMIVIIPFVAFFKLLFREIYKDLSVHL